MSGDISVNLKKFMDRRGINQAQLAEAAGVSQAFISYVLNGKKEPTLAILMNIAKEYNVSLDSLVEGT